MQDAVLQACSLSYSRDHGGRTIGVKPRQHGEEELLSKTWGCGGPVWGAFLRGTGRRICEFQASLHKVFGTTQRLSQKKKKKRKTKQMRFDLTTNDSFHCLFYWPMTCTGMCELPQVDSKGRDGTQKAEGDILVGLI